MLCLNKWHNSKCNKLFDQKCCCCSKIRIQFATLFDHTSFAHLPFYIQSKQWCNEEKNIPAFPHFQRSLHSTHKRKQRDRERERLRQKQGRSESTKRNLLFKCKHLLWHVVLCIYICVLDTFMFGRSADFNVVLPQDAMLLVRLHARPANVIN